MPVGAKILTFTVDNWALEIHFRTLSWLTELGYYHNSKPLAKPRNQVKPVRMNCILIAMPMVVQVTQKAVNQIPNSESRQTHSVAKRNVVNVWNKYV